MAWCPMCKSEYVDGVKSCVDCGCELVDAISDIEAQTQKEELEIAATIAQELEEAPKKFQPVYVNNEEKAQENRSSAFTLLLVGGVGFICVFLFFFDIISFRVSIVSKYMISGVMGVLFLLFIIMGFVSMRNSKILKVKACKENNLTMEIKKWCKVNFHKSEIDLKLELSGIPEEMQYFQRIDYMKEMIQNQFLNLDEAYLDRLIEETYGDIFEGEE